MIDINKINKAKIVICDTVLNQVQDGAQSKELTDAFACGQFLKVPKAVQRGLHGTAAAIRVLAGFESTYNEQLRKLLFYTEKVEREGEKYDQIEGLNVDLNNIIKNAEILNALSYVKSGTANTENLKELISKKLLSCKNNDGGWTYFTDMQDESDMYFTASVYLALKRHNYNNLENTRQFLIDILIKYKKEKIPDPTTFSKLCFIVYTFIKLKEHKKSDETKKLLAFIFNKLWESEYCVINTDFEQNIEYPGRQKHYYVRIPWQLYLLSISNSIAPLYFAQKRSISRFNSLIQSITDDYGFIYKQSGKNISARTYSIVFETFCEIEETFKLNWKFYVLNWFDRIKSILSSKIFKNIVSIIGGILVVYLVTITIMNNQIAVKDIVSSIIATFLILSIQISKK